MIKMNCTKGRPESLAAFLARVRPGDRCACCGAILQPLDRGARTGHIASATSDLRPLAAVMCPECGCEISEETKADAEENLRRLSPAA